MRLREIVEANGMRYLIADDKESVYQVLVAGQVIDEVSQEALGTQLMITASDHASGNPIAGIDLRVLDGGFFCLSGSASAVFPESVPPTTYRVDVAVSAPGYNAANDSVTVPTNPSFPVFFPTLTLRPDPVRVQGRVTRMTDRSALAGALVTLVDDPLGPPYPFGHVVSLRRSLEQSHPAPRLGAGSRAQPFAILGGLRHLASSAPVGATMVVLDNRAGLGTADAIYFGDQVRGDGPLIVLAAPTPVVAATPGAVQLAWPLPAPLEVGTPAQGFTPVGAASALGVEAAIGDGVIFTQVAMAPAAIAVIDAGGGGKEYRLVGALTDASGYYHFDGVGRVRTVFVEAGIGALRAGPEASDLIFGQRINVVDLQAT